MQVSDLKTLQIVRYFLFMKPIHLQSYYQTVHPHFFLFNSIIFYFFIHSLCKKNPMERTKVTAYRYYKICINKLYVFFKIYNGVY